MKNFDLNKRISIQKEIIVEDNCGGFSSTWQEIGKFWANINPINASINTIYLKKNIEATHIIICRYNKDIKSNCKVIYDNREFKIKSIFSPNEDKEFSQILTTEIVI